MSKPDDPRKILKAIVGAIDGIMYMTSRHWATYCNCPDFKKKGHENATCPRWNHEKIHGHIQTIRDLLQVTTDEEVLPDP